MKRIHTLKRTIALFLAMLMAATSTAFANWDSFQGNDTNNGTTDIAITSEKPTSTTVNLPNNGASTGLDVEPLVVGSRIYAFHNGGNNGATVTAVSATNGSQLWTLPVGPEAKDISQVATPVISEKDNTLYGAYTYTDNIFKNITPTVTVDGKTPASLTSVSVPNGSTIKAVYENVNLPGTYGNLQVSTGMASPSEAEDKILSGTVTLTSGSTEKSFSGDSYGTYPYNIYYTNGDPIASGNYKVEVSVTNDTGVAQTWNEFQLLINYWQAFKVTNINTSNPSTSKLKASGAGQASTPFTLAGNKLYFGIFDGDRAYYQYDINTNTADKFTPANSDQFYYAGAVVVDNNAIFGSESGTLYMRPVTNFSEGEGDTKILPDAGRIRSSICYDKEESTGEEYLYLTSYEGFLWKVRLTDSGFGAENHMSVAQGTVKNTVSTPVVAKSGLVYVSVYGYGDNFVGQGYIVATNRSNVDDSYTANVVYGGDQKGEMVQCSPVVYSQGTTDYIYFTTNMPNGSGYCYKCQYASDSASLQWSVTPSSGGNGYAVQGFAMGSYTVGRPPQTTTITFAVFGNDNNQLMIVK